MEVGGPTESDTDKFSVLEVLECSVCLDKLDETSKVLPCQHTFHRQCLERIFETNGSIRCPECRILVANVSINDLPSNILLIRLLEGIKHSQKSLSLRSCPPFNNKCNSSSSSSNSPYQLPPGTKPSFRIAQEIFSSKSNHLNDSDSGNSCIPRPRARALCSYKGTDLWDLSFVKGDIINLRKRVDANWYYGELNGKHGFLPAGFIQILPLQPTTSSDCEQPICKALYDFHANDTGDKTCLSFKKGETIHVIRRVDSNWAEGKLNETLGIFPLNFVELNSSASTLLTRDVACDSSNDSSILQQTDSTNTDANSCNIKLPQFASSSNELGFNNNNNNNNIANNNNNNNNVGQSCNSTGDTSAKTICADYGSDCLDPHPLLGPSSSLTAPSYSGSKRHSLCSPALTSNVASVTVIHQRSKSHQGQFTPNVNSNNIIASTSTNLNVDAPIAHVPMWPADARLHQHQLPPPYDVHDNSIPTNGSTNDIPTIPKQQRRPVAPVYYVALFDYQPRKSDELELVKGELYGVMEKCLDGWFKGFRVRTKEPGVFPGNYLQKSTHHHQQQHQSSSNLLGTYTSHSSTNVLKACSSFSDPEIDLSGPPPLGPKPNQQISQSHQQSSRIHSTSPIGNVYSRPRPVSAIGGVSGYDEWNQSKSPPNASSSSGTLNESTQLSPQWPQVRVAATRMQSSSNRQPHWSGEGTSDSANTYSKMPQSGDESRKKEKKGLMKRWTKRKCKSPTPTRDGYRCDNGSFDRSLNSEYATPCHTSTASINIAHIRSGSCPSEVMSSRRRVTASEERRNDTNLAAPNGPEKYRCTVPFPSNSDFELELHVGDIVLVHKRRDDGWFKGTLARTGKTGLFPASFVELCPKP